MRVDEVAGRNVDTKTLSQVSFSTAYGGHCVPNKKMEGFQSGR